MLYITGPLSLIHCRMEKYLIDCLMQLITSKDMRSYMWHTSVNTGAHMLTVCLLSRTVFGELRLSVQNTLFNVSLWHGDQLTTEATLTCLNARKNKDAN
jgi:hypothetical protein